MRLKLEPTVEKHYNHINFLRRKAHHYFKYQRVASRTQKISLIQSIPVPRSSKFIMHCFKILILWIWSIKCH